MTLRPLAGIKVLDFSNFPPGGACTVMLADLGAQIIRVDPPAQKGKPSLVVGQVALSRGKTSLALDMRNPAASTVLERLAPVIDVVVESARPGAMAARGFGYRQAQLKNPGIIWCALTGFGQTGPYAMHAGHDLSYAAHSGLLGALAPALPWHPALSLSLQAGAMSAVIGIQAALLQRAQTGSGAFLDISLSEAATWLLTCGINPLSDHPYALQATPDRRLYACADNRFVAVASAEPRSWEALCDGLGVPEFKPHLHQPDWAAAVALRLSEIFQTRPAREWVERLAPAGAAVSILNHGKDLLTDPHVLARGSVAAVSGMPVPASPIRMSTMAGDHNATADDPPHLVGQDSADVLAAAGFAAREIAELEAQGII